MVGIGKKSIFFLIAMAVFAAVFVAPNSAKAEDLMLMRRWVVFPFDADVPGLKNAAENAWWKSRERLTAEKKYLVASRQFLIQKDVFQPRKDLNPDDVKLLAHLLDADVIVTGYSEARGFQLNVYLGQNGELFWSKRISFHPSLKATDQLELISDNITQELLSQIPYQGFVVTDPLIGKTLYDEDSKKYAVVDMGTTDSVTEGMDVQWVKIYIPEKPTLKEGDPILPQSKIQVVAEGKITKIKRGVFVAQVERAKSMDLIGEGTFVVIPKLASKLGESYLAHDIVKEKNAPELLPTMINPVAPESQGAKKQTLIFGSVISVIGLLLLGL
jgi:hypothetical protein